ncbi:MAG: hypothetical protein RLZZ453_264 [Chlamydiota bacterium]|jgi:hypothetical protein
MFNRINRPPSYLPLPYKSPCLELEETIHRQCDKIRKLEEIFSVQKTTPCPHGLDSRLGVLDQITKSLFNHHLALIYLAEDTDRHDIAQVLASVPVSYIIISNIWILPIIHECALTVLTQASLFYGPPHSQSRATPSSDADIESNDRASPFLNI